MKDLTLGSSAIRQLDGLYSLNDLHTAAGGAPKHQPNRFLRLEQTHALAAEIGHHPDMGSAIKTINGGPRRGSYVCRELVIAYAMWISPAFHLKVIRAFDAPQAQPLAPAAKRNPSVANEEGIRELARWAAEGVIKPYLDKIEEHEALARVQAELARTQRQLIVAQKNLLTQTRRELRRFTAPPCVVGVDQLPLDLGGA